MTELNKVGRVFACFVFNILDNFFNDVEISSEDGFQTISRRKCRLAAIFDEGVDESQFCECNNCFYNLHCFSDKAVRGIRMKFSFTCNRLLGVRET